MVFDGILIGLIVGFIRAGLKNGLHALSEVRIRGGLIFPLLFIVQLLLIYLQDHSHFLAQNNGYLFMVVYLLGLYLIWLNRHEKGFWFIFAGVALNTLVMLVNGGRMPVSEEAASVLDPIYIKMLKEDPVVYKHILMTESTRLPFLGDIISLSSPYPRRQAISIGDVIMNFGIFIYLQKVMLVHKVQAALVEIK
ncbi:DUF5317 domain-containing protein [Paenibacillus sp. GCM10027628]|uniref:DUF5317 domain-containing protein n=1 Tax=Paenibacillus sp. GCM10027628 TaxID=3273413 RepID=UPI003630F1F0